MYGDRKKFMSNEGLDPHKMMKYYGFQRAQMFWTGARCLPTRAINYGFGFTGWFSLNFVFKNAPGQKTRYLGHLPNLTTSRSADLVIEVEMVRNVVLGSTQLISGYFGNFRDTF